MRTWAWGLRTAALAIVLATGACRPSSVGEAEAKGDISWLDAAGTADATAALGRLADKNSGALKLLQARASFDGNAYFAAWAAVKRGQAWGPEMLRTALANPQRAEIAALAMVRRDPALVQFVPDLDGALSRLSGGLRAVTLGAILASIGPPAHAAVARRLADGTSRATMCEGIATPDASADARATLIAAPPESRDHAMCVSAVATIAIDDDPTLNWLATTAEPGLLTAAGKLTTMPCARMHLMWTKAITDRPAQIYSALTVPLQTAIARCPQAMDGVLADSLEHVGVAEPFLVEAIDPLGNETPGLKATCAELRKIEGRNVAPVVRDRVAQILGACNH